jgi:6-phosphogluconate dehydrogenase
MSKYIDADKLIAEIERRKNQTERRINNIVPIRRKDTMDEEQLAKIELRDKVDKAYLNGVLITLSDILSFITSLQQEQPEVDLLKALDDYYNKEEFGPSDAIEYEIHKDIARHFYELGKNARKEE